MALDISMELMHATVQLEQPLGDGTRTVGTGFLITSVGADGRPQTVLITAGHVLQKMPKANARIGYRIANADGSWTYSPQTLKVRDDAGKPLWTKHPDRDVAAIAITAPEEFAKAAIPEGYLATDETFSRYQVAAGDEMMALGYPRGLAANQAGFPILRSGRVASYPIAPSDIFPTFLLDFSVFPGNSGGPVFMKQAGHQPTSTTGDNDGMFIAGLLTQQVELNNERLEIGIVTQARYIRETIALMHDPKARITVARAETAMQGAKAASAEEAVAPD